MLAVSILRENQAMPVEIKQVTKQELEQYKSLGAGTSVTLVEKAELPVEYQQVLSSQALSTDDEFEELYALDTTHPDKPQILRPAYPPNILYKMVHENNALGQCIAAYEVNVDGTGYDIKPKDETQETEEESDLAAGVVDFFDEVYPRISFIALRRALRRDSEITGNGYVEVLRNLEGTLVFLKHVESKNMRLIKLDDPIPVEVEVMRFGVTEKIQLMERQRRFVQMVGKKLVYFKEFGVERHLDKLTGRWESEDNIVPPENRATEILWFTIEKDALSPYGIPRWVRQTPSALGSRRAEELNLDYFNAGGLPPALIILQGGTLMKETRKELQTYLTGKGSNKHRAAIVEAHATGTTTDRDGSVKVAVERFGSERATDSMFENYDDKCEKRIRTSFRLPPLFVGRTDDYSYASAFASYTVAEAQVFAPEREEFDQYINVTIMRELAPGFKFKSQPLAVNDVALRLQALDLVKDKVEDNSLVETVSEISDLALTLKEEPDEPETPPGADMENLPPGVVPFQQPNDQGVPVEPPTRIKMDSIDLIYLAEQWALAAAGQEALLDQAQMEDMVRTLDNREREMFDGYVTLKLMSRVDHDLEGVVQLTSAAIEACNHDAS